MKAKLLKSLRINGKSVKASSDDPVIVDLSDKEFKRLAAMRAVAEPTEKDLKLAGISVEADTDDEGQAQAGARGRKATGGNAGKATAASVDL